MNLYDRFIYKAGKLSYILSAAFLIAALLVSMVPPAPAYADPAGAGSIWTTGTTCNNPDPQDDNLYATFETVYIRGDGFVVSTPLTWVITQVSGPDKTLIAEGVGSTDIFGYFCVTAHTIQPGESGTFTLDVTVGTAVKNDNYRVSELTATPTNTSVPPTATNTSVPPTATNTSVPPTATNTSVPPTATNTSVPPTATNTSVPPTATNTSVPPTATSTSVPPTATNTSAPPTATNTGVPPTATNTGVPPTATNTPVPPTATNTSVPPTATNTSVSPTATQPTATEPTATETTPSPTETTPPPVTPSCADPDALNYEGSLPCVFDPIIPVTGQVLIPVTGVEFGSGRFGSQGLFLASIAFFGLGLVLSGAARKREEENLKLD